MAVYEDERTAPSADASAAEVPQLADDARTPMQAGVRRPIFVLLVAFVLVYLLWQLTRFGGHGDPVAIGDLSFVLALGLAVAATEGAAHRRAGSARLVRSWHLISVGLFAYLVANAIQGYREVVQHELAYPSLADAAYLSFYGFFFAGLIGFARKDGTRAQRAKLALDVLIVAIASSMVLWYLVAGPSVLAQGQSHLETLIAVAYPVGDLLLLVSGVAALLRGVPRASRGPVVALLVGLVIYVLSDLAYGYIVLHSEYHGGDRVDMGWMLATVAFAFAASMVPSGKVHDPGEHLVPPVAPRAAVLPYAATAVGFGLLLLSQRHQPFFPDISLALGAMALALAVTVRQAVAQRALQAQQSRNDELVDQLRHQAFHDPLTGLPNRALFGERLEHALARQQRSMTVVAVVMLDLDEFKAVNDSLGHSVGDDLLRVVAERLRRTVRPGDTVARFGGDEFAIVLEDLSDTEAALSAAGRILSMMRRTVEVGGRPLSTSASIGLAVSGRQAITGEQLLREADTAMYAAKVGGRNRFRLFELAMRADLDERAELTADLRGAWNRGELTVAYQPIMDLQTGGLTGFEALARWQHPTRGPVAPDVFIRLAEELGVVHELDHWVLTEACRRAERWQRDHPSLPTLDLHVNISPRQLLEPDLPARVSTALRGTGLNPGQLTLELVESSLVADGPLVVERFVELKALGIRIAIDDFGTGYSSLSYLQRLPVDVLKIDRSFISGMNESEPGAALVHALVQLGAVLGLEVVAEGIEDGAQLQQLQEEGCPRGQGYLFSRPMTSPELDLYLTSLTGVPMSVGPVPATLRG